jgi:hypothetical protein
MLSMESEGSAQNSEMMLLEKREKSSKAFNSSVGAESTPKPPRKKEEKQEDPGNVSRLSSQSDSFKVELDDNSRVEEVLPSMQKDKSREAAPRSKHEKVP